MAASKTDAPYMLVEMNKAELNGRKGSPGPGGLGTLCGEQDPELGLRGGQYVHGKGKGAIGAGAGEPRQGRGTDRAHPSSIKRGPPYSNTVTNCLRLLHNLLLVLLLSTFPCSLHVFPNEQVYFEHQKKQSSYFHSQLCPP